jgi:diguanylate cyclase (GGDEF)-like protein
MDFSKDCILIVDDSPFIINNLTKTLQDDYTVISALSGKDALNLLELENIDLILLDLVLPDLSGYDVCKQLKNNYKTRNVPVIFISDQGEIDDQLSGFALGAIDYMVKPLIEPILKAKIKNHLNLKKRNDKLETLSLFDELTNIANRRYFNKALNREWKHALRNHDFLSLLFIDIDFFKAYNDFYGHLAGDHCLQQIAKALKRSLLRPDDMVARYGGEEFTVILPATNIPGAVEVAQNINNNIANLKILHLMSKINSYVTVSIGVVSMTPTNNFNCIDFVSKADMAMYKSKKNGRNRITIIDVDFKK